MSRSWCRLKPADEQILVPVHVTCPACGRAMRIRYSNHRAIVSLRGLVRVRLKIRRCELWSIPSGVAAGSGSSLGAAAA
jgi:RNase P subunit RPR2